MVTSVASLKLARLSPNPVSRSPAVTFEARASSPVDFVVTDVQGREVASRRLGVERAGERSIMWDELSRLPSGLYWLRARQAEQTSTLRFVVTR